MLRRLTSAERWQTWICVPVATLFEIFGSMIWGGYHYRLQNIPLYVPPGHALVWQSRRRSRRIALVAERA